MSFAADMKDFNTAVAQGQKMVGAVDDRAYNQTKKDYLEAQTETLNQKNNDKEGQAADLALKQAGIRLRNGQVGLMSERVRASQELRAQAKAQAAVDATTAAGRPAAIAGSATPQGAAPPTEVAPAPQAVPADPTPATPDGIPAPPEPAPVDLAYSAGGSVQKFAGGGAVAADDEEEDPEVAADPQAAAVPADDQGTSDTTDISARRRGFSGQAGLDGVEAGLTYGSKALGLHTPGSAVGGASPGRQRAAKAWASGAHAAPAEDMVKIGQAIDPDGKMSESERNLASIGAVYQFKMKSGDTDGAAKAAFQMIQYHRQASQRYAVIAAHAFQNGDLDTGVHAAMKAYANVPDDKDVKLQKTPDGQISYTYTDGKTGKVMSQGIESPDKLASAAMGFAEKGFDQSLAAAVTQHPAAKPAVDPNTAPMKGPDKKNALAAVDASYKNQNPDPTEEDGQAPAGPARSKDEERTLKGAALRIGNHTANGRITPDEAMSVATKIADPAVLGKSKMENKKVDGGYAVSIDGRKPVFVADDDMGALMVQRNTKVKAADQKTADAKKPTAVARAMTAAKGIAKPAMDYLNSEADGPKTRKQAAMRATFTDPQVP